MALVQIVIGRAHSDDGYQRGCMSVDNSHFRVPIFPKRKSRVFVFRISESACDLIAVDLSAFQVRWCCAHWAETLIRTGIV